MRDFAEAGEIQGYGLYAPVQRADARCTVCPARRDNVHAPLARSWAAQHERDMSLDPGRVHEVTVTVPYHEIGLSSDHWTFFRRWAADIREDFRAHARRRDFFRCVP